MPAFLKTRGDILAVEFGGLRGAEFTDALARVKSIPGRRWNPDDKAWEFPKDADTAIRIMQMLEPVADAEVQAIVQQHNAAVSDQLLTKLPDDATLEIPYAAALRPYQRAAVNFMVAHPHTILADEMGTGKTLQAIATVSEFYTRNPLPDASDDQPSLVVCPNSVRGTWVQEYERWEEGTHVEIIDGKNPAKRKEQAGNPHADVFVVNWEKLRLMPELAQRNWRAVIADEIHRGKNRKAQQTKALWKLKAPVQLGLTGTPVMNHPGDLWAILRWLRPEQYTGYWPFHYSYVDEYQTKFGSVITGVRNADQLRFELSDKLVRRTKRDVLRDLPPKTVQTIPVELTAKQRKLYKAAEDEFLLDIEKVLAEKAEESPEEALSLAEKIEHASAAQLQYLIPNGGARTTRLRQIASTPALLGGPDDSAKLDAAVELIRDQPGKPFVVFTWFSETARILASRLSKGKPKLRVDTIAGSDDADPVKDAFQAGELDIVVATIAKGGVGLTLTAADTAIFIERDWTPANNIQAEDRLHRIGQTEAVSIIVLEAADTIDSGKIAPMNRLKASIAAQVLGDSE